MIIHTNIDNTCCKRITILSQSLERLNTYIKELLFHSYIRSWIKLMLAFYSELSHFQTKDVLQICSLTSAKLVMKMDFSC